MPEKRFKGIAASPGITIGKVFLFDRGEDSVVVYDIKKDDIPKEITKLENALIQTRKEILELQEKITQGMGKEHAEIFNAQLLVVEDRALIEEVIKKLETERKNVEYVFQQVAKKYVKIFSQMEDEYLRERASDITDVSHRIIHNLLGKKREDLAHLKDAVVVIAYDLSPSDTAMMHKEKVIGFATDIGSRTSHTAIMARSLEIPAVVGLHDISQKIQAASSIIIDGNNGLVIVDPSQETIATYTKEKNKRIQFESKLSELRKLPAETKDGYRIVLASNIELPEDVQSVIHHGAEGIGLYRTEYLFLSRTNIPTEEEHFEAYKTVVKKTAPNSVVIRTMDLGGDKFLSHLEMPKEINPYLGWRAIRFSLARLDLFKTQLRAILRASVYGKLKIMYPMISGIGELKKANDFLEKVKDELRKEGTRFDPDIEVGAMIEVPSAALIADILAQEVDFFSIGTNDLIQYALAIDRVNEKVAYLYEPTHPAIIRLIKLVIDSAHKAGIWVGLCGELAGDPVTALICVGLGIDELSTSAVVVPEIKKAIRSLSMLQLQELISEIIEYKDGKQIYKRVEKLIRKEVPELLIGGGSK
jgi:phosphotransferase system enzyme I (PtsI)